jgi:hypothetical protein
MSAEARVDVYRVVYVNEEGNHTALVFQEPVVGKAYHAGQMFVLPGASEAAVNDEGDIPHREPSGDPAEDLGITWHFQK